MPKGPLNVYDTYRLAYGVLPWPGRWCTFFFLLTTGGAFESAARGGCVKTRPS